MFYKKLEACYCIKKRLWHNCFPVNFAKLSRTTFLQNSPEDRLCMYHGASMVCSIISPWFDMKLYKYTNRKGNLTNLAFFLKIGLQGVRLVKKRPKNAQNKRFRAVFCTFALINRSANQQTIQLMYYITI